MAACGIESCDMPTNQQCIIEIANEQSAYEIDKRALKAAVRSVLTGEGIARATISVAVVDDPTIHRLNRQFLKHDYPTDVLSFVLENDENGLDGEIVVSADTAARTCAEYGWSSHCELTLYLIHGSLHLVGYDDHSAAHRAKMRERETHYLRKLGIAVPTPVAKRSPSNRQKRRPGK